MLRSATAPNAAPLQKETAYTQRHLRHSKLPSRVAPEKMRSSTRPKNSMVNEEPSLI